MCSAKTKFSRPLTWREGAQPSPQLTSIRNNIYQCKEAVFGADHFHSYIFETVLHVKMVVITGKLLCWPLVSFILTEWSLIVRPIALTGLRLEGVTPCYCYCYHNYYYYYYYFNKLNNRPIFPFSFCCSFDSSLSILNLLWFLYSVPLNF